MTYIGAGIYFWQRSYTASMENIEKFGGMIFIFFVYLIYFATIFVFYILENNAWKNGSKDAFNFKISELPLYYQLFFITALCFAFIPLIIGILNFISYMIKY